MNRSQMSNDFNFDMELDISKSKKDKTQNFFSKEEGFAFQDFMNIGDRTMKSQKFQSKLGHNTSLISKDGQINSHFVDQVSSHSIKRKQTRDQMLIRSSTSHNLTLSGNVQNLSGGMGVLTVPSPKFAQSNTTKTIQLSPKKQFTLRRVNQDLQRSKPQITNISLMPDQMQNAFVKKQTPQQTLQKQYKSLQSQIKFYEQQTQKMIYQSTKVQEQTQSLMMNFNAQCYQRDLEQHSAQINIINTQIQEQKQLQYQLSRMIVQLQEEYDHGLYSVKNSKFPRPTIVKDQAKVLIDQINQLKAQLQALERDDGSLNLSSTLLNTHSMQHPSSVSHKKPEQTARIKIQQIQEQNKVSQDPRFLLNLKMSCLKTQWCLFTNSQIQVNVSYRDVPKVLIRFGNKLSKDLQKCTIKHNNNSFLEGQTIAANSYYSHIFEVTPTMINELFVKIDLNYQIDGQKKKITLFVSLGLTNFGQFSPITYKQFQHDAGKQQFPFISSSRPLDKKLISSVNQITVFMPNLLSTPQKCSGLFIFPFEDCDLVTFRQRGQMLSIATKNQNWPLLRLLEFIFTV